MCICEVYLEKCGLCVNFDVYLENVNYIYIMRTNLVSLCWLRNGVLSGVIRVKLLIE